MKNAFRPGYSSGYDHVFGCIRELHCTWLVPHTRASSDGIDVSDSGEWIYLKRGVDRGGCGPISLRGQHIMLCGGVGRLVESQEGLETKVIPRADLVAVPRICSLFLPMIWRVRLFGNRLLIWCLAGVEAALMCLDSLRLPSFARNPHVGSCISVVKINSGRSEAQ
ncbi:hypothetical protein M9H77_03705 [Catharanthus roseus]|uniref:Uncharacterized protein n=1 Tax=Catharanthus roseus TaxID=4058 RepID=A0ACC0CBZ9_CATRO|nr:hypothetical protein M9H77_03705 [Catharanthus roseus]